QPVAPQDRKGSSQSAAVADRTRLRLPSGDDAMTTLDLGKAKLRTAAAHLSSLYERYGFSLRNVMPKGLYARALLIIIVPMVVLQSVVAFVFMERHWNTVTQRLSNAVVQDIAALIDIYTTYPQD